MTETDDVRAARFFVRLHWLIAAQMPRKGVSYHIYSNDNMYKHLKTKSDKQLVKGKANIDIRYTWTLTISDGVPYSAYAMGYDKNGNKRQPRGWREALNFAIIDNCIKQAAKETAFNGGGKVVVK